MKYKPESIRSTVETLSITTHIRFIDIAPIFSIRFFFYIPSFIRPSTSDNLRSSFIPSSRYFSLYYIMTHNFKFWSPQFAYTWLACRAFCIKLLGERDSVRLFSVFLRGPEGSLETVYKSRCGLNVFECLFGYVINFSSSNFTLGSNWNSSFLYIW